MLLSKHKCRMSTEWHIVSFHLCDFLESRLFSGHGAFVRSTIDTQSVLLRVVYSVNVSESFYTWVVPDEGL